MIRTTEDALRQRIAELEAENARLRDSLEFVKAERRELRERAYGPVREEDVPTEEQLAELMKDRIDGRKACEELGLLPPRPAQP
jgi:predicted nuclease with TOPRIM domain